MERETKKIITPNSKQEIVLKSWLTGGEKRDITYSMLDGSSISDGDEKLKVSGDLLKKSQDLTFSTVIVSIGDTKENIIETVLNMRSVDFDFIVSEVNKITNGVEEAEVKKN